MKIERGKCSKCGKENRALYLSEKMCRLCVIEDINRDRQEAISYYEDENEDDE